MSNFEVHWGRVHGDVLERAGAGDRALFAIWPSPVNLDACFEAAGWRQFDDADGTWDERADALRERLLTELLAIGAPRLQSEPLRTHVPWFARFFRRAEPLPLREQIDLPTHWDSLPCCRVAFGDRGHGLVVGDGHHLYWLFTPAAEAPHWATRIAALAAPWPAIESTLAWEHLFPARLA